MSKTIEILGININRMNSKEALRKVNTLSGKEPLAIVEIITSEELLSLEESQELKAEMKTFDLVLAGDKGLLEAVSLAEERYLPLLLRQLQRNHSRVFVLANNEGECREFAEYLRKDYGIVSLAGAAVLSAEHRDDDLLVNAINGSDVDCVLSVLASPLQEDFIVNNKKSLNAKLWLGTGDAYQKMDREERGIGKLTAFIKQRIFKKKIGDSTPE